MARELSAGHAAFLDVLMRLRGFRVPVRGARRADLVVYFFFLFD
ncbi:hypothetical protein [Burkholderia perseverans]|nr:hypothetical protein [Burkholderia perseverans]